MKGPTRRAAIAAAVRVDRRVDLAFAARCVPARTERLKDAGRRRRAYRRNRPEQSPGNSV